jgi:phosphatidyl-myo-inositol dimannoside synthase
MKLLLLTWDFPPGRGGIQTWMFELARRMPNVEMTVVARSVPGAREFDAASGLHMRRLSGMRFGRLAWLLQLCAITLVTCLIRRPRLIVCGHVITAPAALLARRVLAVPYVVFAYGSEIRRKRRRRLTTLLLRQARLVLACSGFTRSTLVDLGVPEERVRVLHPGVDARHFTPGDGNRSGRPKTILSVSRLSELYKGHDTVLRALPLIRAKCPDVRYLIVGDGPLRNYLPRIAYSVGVEGDVAFLGEVADDDLCHRYQEADVVVLLSRESPSHGGAEGFGIVCLEAAACGKPVVAGRSGGLPDAVRDGVTGILVDPRDLAAAAEAIVLVLRDPAFGRRLGQAGREMVLARFTWDRVAAEARALFLEAAGA